MVKIGSTPTYAVQPALPHFELPFAERVEQRVKAREFYAWVKKEKKVYRFRTRPQAEAFLAEAQKAHPGLKLDVGEQYPCYL